MKKTTTTIALLAVVCQFGCAVFPPFIRKEEQAKAEQLCLVDFHGGQQVPAQLQAESWENKYSSGLKLTTEHYEVYTTLLDPLVLGKIPGFLECAHQAYNSQLPAAANPNERSRIYIFKDREQWEDFTKLLTGPQAGLFLKIRQGAYCYRGSCVAYDIGPKRTLAALSHEGWHQFTSRHFRFRLPSWLDEGIAMQFEGFRCVNGHYEFQSSLNHYRIRALSGVLTEQDSIPLEELLRISPGEVMATDRAESVMAFYSQSYALVRFLQ